MNKISAVFYGINGTGLGHISRLTNIAREMKVLLNAMSIQADFHMLTTPEAPQVSYDFPTWKIPSKTVINSSEYQNQKYIGDANFFVTNMMATLRPNYLIVDTVPQCSFGEFLNLKLYADQTVFINRHRREEIAKEAISQECMKLYNLIFTPDYSTASNKYDYLTPELKMKNRYTSMIHGFRPENTMSKDEVRDYFSVKPHQKVVYISAGGGGDKHVESVLKNLVNSIVEFENLVVLIGYGPLYRGKKIYQSNIIPLIEVDVRKYFRGVDIAICAAGYNTFEELISAKVPTAFYSLEKGWDSQEDRILEGVKSGNNLYLENLEPESIKHILHDLLGTKGQDIRNHLSHRPLANGAVVAATEMLKLKFGFRKEPKLYQNLLLAMSLRTIWSDFIISETKSEVSPDQLFVDMVKNVLLHIEYAFSESLIESIFEESQDVSQTGLTSNLLIELMSSLFHENISRMEQGVSDRTLIQHLKKQPKVSTLDKSENIGLVS
jgi:UDP-N-acetylglucosamine--N-acetylmuramyl-(pentapeptide) pyrophosphoryl-undecaprenol N-acetylglucosamine transferase